MQFQFLRCELKVFHNHILHHYYIITTSVFYNQFFTVFIIVKVLACIYIF